MVVAVQQLATFATKWGRGHQQASTMVASGMVMNQVSTFIQQNLPDWSIAFSANAGAPEGSGAAQRQPWGGRRKSSRISTWWMPAEIHRKSSRSKRGKRWGRSILVVTCLVLELLCSLWPQGKMKELEEHCSNLKVELKLAKAQPFLKLRYVLVEESVPVLWEQEEQKSRPVVALVHRNQQRLSEWPLQRKLHLQRMAEMRESAKVLRVCVSEINLCQIIGPEMSWGCCNSKNHAFDCYFLDLPCTVTTDFWGIRTPSVPQTAAISAWRVAAFSHLKSFAHFAQKLASATSLSGASCVFGQFAGPWCWGTLVLI